MERINHWAESPPIPQGTKPLPHQVAGHIFGRDNGHKKNKIGFLQSDDGHILKPVLGPKKGIREVEFYKMVNDASCDDETILSLRKFLPGFVDVWITPEHPGLSYLKLEDITRKFVKPCIMDIKVGPVTYDMEADAFKIQREISKFPALDQVGFQVVGIKVYSPVTDSYKTVDRTFLRALDKTTILTQGISQYFNYEESFETEIVKSFLHRLSDIEAWFLNHSKYTFTASSLLFVYEGRAPHLHPHLKTLDTGEEVTMTEDSILKRTTAEEEECNAVYDSLTDVRMIDFTHAFPVENKRDDNYLTGLQSVIRYLSDLLAMTDKAVSPIPCR